MAKRGKPARRSKNNKFQERLDYANDVAMVSFSSKIADKLRENIQSMWYDGYDGDEDSYQRTYELLESVSEDDYAGGEGKIVYMDNDKIHSSSNRPGWGIHQGFDDSEVYDLPLMLNDGTQGNPKGGNPRAGVAGEFLDDTYEWVQREMMDEMNDVIKKELRLMGVKSRVGNVGGSVKFGSQGIRFKLR